MITIRGAAGPAIRAAFEDVELTVANDTTVMHRSGGDQLWAGPAGTAARSEGSARTSQRATRAGWYGDLTPHRLPEILRFSPCPNS